MSATEELRRLLDERGVTYTMRYRLTNGPSEIATKLYVTDKDNKGYAIIDTECSAPGGVMLTVNATPKQAVEIVAGRGTCRRMPADDATVVVRRGGFEMEFTYFECSECGAYVMDNARYCPNCGRKVSE